jgi:hypothetical protein
MTEVEFPTKRDFVNLTSFHNLRFVGKLGKNLRIYYNQPVKLGCNNYNGIEIETFNYKVFVT